LSRKGGAVNRFREQAIGRNIWGLLRIRVAANHERMSRQAAARIAREVRRDPGLLMGAVTGETPTRTYAWLAQTKAAEPSLFRRMRVLKLDEWMGVPPSDPGSCEAYLRRHLLGPLGIDDRRYQGWRSRPRRPAAECHRIAEWLAAEGPIDLCVLGLGRNGHLLMNEPAPSHPPGPHVARLSASTRRHSMVRAMKPRPRFGLTMGLGDILRSRAVVLPVSGRHKAAPLRRMLEGRVTTQRPASLLWLHGNVTVYCDRAAAGRLQGAPR
jgi:galactosamine-6-phosphate isomerase